MYIINIYKKINQESFYCINGMPIAHRYNVNLDYGRYQ